MMDYIHPANIIKMTLSEVKNSQSYLIRQIANTDDDQTKLHFEYKLRMLNCQYETLVSTVRQQVDEMVAL